MKKERKTNIKRIREIKGGKDGAKQHSSYVFSKNFGAMFWIFGALFGAHSCFGGLPAMSDVPAELVPGQQVRGHPGQKTGGIRGHPGASGGIRSVLGRCRPQKHMGIPTKVPAEPGASSGRAGLLYNIKKGKLRFRHVFGRGGCRCNGRAF